MNSTRKKRFFFLTEHKEEAEEFRDWVFINWVQNDLRSNLPLMGLLHQEHFIYIRLMIYLLVDRLEIYPSRNFWMKKQFMKSENYLILIGKKKKQ